MGENINEIITKVVHLLRTEFLGEGYIDRDSPQYAEKYVHALLKLELNDCGPAFFHVRPHSMGETRFFCVVGKPFKKTVWSRHLFLFYFKGEKQNKKEKP